jgi:hypothetical protein
VNARIPSKLPRQEENPSATSSEKMDQKPLFNEKLTATNQIGKKEESQNSYLVADFGGQV